MAFLVFIGFLYPPLAWKVFLCSQKGSPKDFLSVVVVYAFFFSAQGTQKRSPIRAALDLALSWKLQESGKN